MKAKVAKAVIKKVFGAVSGVVPSNTPMPITQDILLVVDATGVATLTGTNQREGFVHRMEVSDADPGVTLLPTEKVKRVLSAWADPVVEIEAADRQVRLLGPSADYEFQTPPPEQFPVPAAFVAADYHVIEARDLKRLIARTAFAIDPVSRSALAGVLAKPGDCTMTFIAADGRRAAWQVVPATREGNPVHPRCAVSIPPKALALLDSHLAVEDAPVHVAFTESAAFFRTATAVITASLVSGHFPDFSAALNGRSFRRVEMTAGALSVAVRQAAVMSDEVTRSVDFRFERGLLRILGMAEGHTATARAMAAYDGEPYELRLTPSYLVQALGSIGESQSIRLELGGASSILTDQDLKDGVAPQSFILRTTDDYTYLVAPMNR